jgi:hypothetical protein
MFGSPFYNRTLRKYVVGFGNLFNNIKMIRFKQDGVTEVDRMTVPLLYGPKEKFITRLTQDPDLNRNTQTILPRMAFEIAGMSYDPTRKPETNLKYRTTAPGSGARVKSRYSGTPYDINFELYIMVRNIEDGNQIVEQILPYFSPVYNLSLGLLSDFPEDFTTVPITLNAVNQSIDYEGDYETTRMIIWTLSFTMKGWFYGPTSTQNVITTAITNIFDSSSKLLGINDQIQLNMNSMTPNSSFLFDDLVYQGASQATATAVGTVLEWKGSPLNRLTVKVLGGAFQLNTETWATSTNAVGNVASFYVPDQKAITITITPNPVTANADSDYGYTTVIQEWPDLI